MSAHLTSTNAAGPWLPSNSGWIRMGIGITAVAYGLVTITRGLILRDITPVLMINATTAVLCFAAYLCHVRWPRPSGLFVVALVWLQLTHHVYVSAMPETTSMLVYPALMLALGLFQGEAWAVGGAILTGLVIPVAIFAGRQAQAVQGDVSSVVASIIVVEIILLASGFFAHAVLASSRRLLAESERLRWRYTRLFQDMPDGLVEIDPAGRIAEVNVAAARLLKASREELLGGLLMEAMNRCGMGHGLVPADLRPGNPVMLQAGTNYIEITAGTPPDALGSILLVMRDVTLRHRTLERQALVQRLETVGQLAAGIAHEFNNLLTAIGGNAGLLKIHADREVQGFAGQILIAQQRAATLTRQMLAFARHDFHQPEVISLGQELQEWGKLLRHLLGHHGRLEIKGSGAARVEADPVQIEQILVHLINNARDAIPPGGVVELRYSSLVRSAANRLGSSLTAPAQVMLEVADRGHGMTADVKSRLFEPFFTTKPTGQGTGLGLAAVHGLVTQNHGDIEIESEVGRGTTVRLFFAELEQERRPAGPDAPLPGKNAPRGHVLLVDDDATTNKTAVFALEQAGFRVTVVGQRTAAGAMDFIQQVAAEIHLAVISAVIPGISGREVGGMLRKLRPGLPVLYVCGRFEVPSDWPADDTETPLLMKPFRPEQLLKRVESLLPAKER